MRILHLSDLHFGREQAEVMVALRHSLRHLHPDLIVISGDLTQRARVWQFSRARHFTDSLAPTPLLVVPGNHDIPLLQLWNRFGRPFKRYQNAFGEGLMQAYKGDVSLTGLCSATPWRHTHGVVSAAHLQRRLEELREGVRFYAVVMHHPLATSPGDPHHWLSGSERLAQAFSQTRVDLVLSGHTHIPYVAEAREHFTGLDYSFVLCTAGTTVSSRLRQGISQSFQSIEINATRELIRIERFDYQQHEFQMVARWQFERSANGWSAL